MGLHELLEHGPRVDLESELVELLAGGADLEQRHGPSDEAPLLHQAAWFGQPANARLLLDAGAPLEVFEGFHGSSPLGWAVHGARFSGGAAERVAAYEEVVAMLLEAGAGLAYPDEEPGPEAAYVERLLGDAVPGVRRLLDERMERGA